MSPLSTARSHVEPPFRLVHATTRMPALADRATQVIALTARVWGLRPQTTN
jgi:hypothetical protein